MRFRLSLLALRDIEDIRAYTVDRWGREQWLRYFAGMSDAFDRIVADPTCGRPRDLIRARMRSLPCDRHLIFFEPAPNVGGMVVILRIVHERRNFAALSYHDELET